MKRYSFRATVLLYGVLLSACISDNFLNMNTCEGHTGSCFKVYKTVIKLNMLKRVTLIPLVLRFETVCQSAGSDSLIIHDSSTS